MDPLSVEEIARMCGGEVVRGGDTVVEGAVSKDTRTLAPGDLYFALRGENFDGAAFVGDAVARGAVAVVVERPVDGNFPVILVPDALAALQRLARAWRDRLDLKVVGITGSSGKTSTKEFTAAVLSQRYRVVKTEGNLNNHIGVPLSIVSATSSHQAAVWEMGMNHRGEIAPLARMTRPDAAIITNIGVAHIEYLGSREAIAEEKGDLAAVVAPQGCVVLCADDDMTPAIAARCQARVIQAGLSGGGVTAEDVRVSESGCRFVMNTGDERVDVALDVPGVHMVRNALLAAAVGIDFGLSASECAEGLSLARLTGGRLARRVIREVTVLDDTYNANPDSVEAALRTLADMDCAGRRIAVLGRMGELGDYASIGYARVGRSAAECVDVVIAVGSDCAPMTESAREAGEIEIHEVSSTAEAGAVLRRIARPGDIVLVKGSRSARMEGVIQTFEI